MSAKFCERSRNNLASFSQYIHELSSKSLPQENDNEKLIQVPIIWHSKPHNLTQPNPI